MNSSAEIDKLAEALAKAQGDMESAKKDSANPFFKSKYADLAAVVEAIKKPFADNGLSYVQMPDFDDTGAVIITTRLMHSSGQWIEGPIRMRPVKDDPQGIGSTITYARRYALQSMAGVPAEDDDGNAGTHPTNGAAAASGPPRRAAAAKGAAKDGREPAAPPDEAMLGALTDLKNTFAHLYREHPDVMPYTSDDRNEKATKARLAIVSQVHGSEVSDIRALSLADLKDVTNGIREMWAVK